MPLPLGNLGAVVLASFGEDVVRERRATSTLGTDGFWTRGALTSMTIQASVQEYSGADLQKLPEGERT